MDAIDKVMWMVTRYHAFVRLIVNRLGQSNERYLGIQVQQLRLEMAELREKTQEAATEHARTVHDLQQKEATAVCKAKEAQKQLQVGQPIPNGYG